MQVEGNKINKVKTTFYDNVVIGQNDMCMMMYDVLMIRAPLTSHRCDCFYITMIKHDKPAAPEQALLEKTAHHAGSSVLRDKKCRLTYKMKQLIQYTLVRHTKRH